MKPLYKMALESFLESLTPNVCRCRYRDDGRLVHACQPCRKMVTDIVSKTEEKTP